MRQKATAFTKYLTKFTLSSRLTLQLGLEIITGVATSLTTLFLFLKIADSVLEKEVYGLDHDLLKYFMGMRNPVLSKVMLGVTFLGSGTFLIVSSAIIITVIFLIRKKDAYIYAGMLYSGIIVNLALKMLFQVTRPDLSPLISENSYSFPSAHAMNSFVFYFMTTYFIFRLTKSLKITILVGLTATLLVLFIGISRIYLGVHYPSDVIAGYTAGLFWLISALVFDKTIIFERLYLKSKIK